jgi:aryl-alcohol dehydrogenase-like predicted oxidoreductase
VHPIAAVQSEWSLFSRDIEAGVVPAARELGVTLVPYSPLGRGFLTGSFTNAEHGPHRGRLPPHGSPATPATTRRRTRPSWSRSGRWRRPTTPPLGQIALAWVHQQASVHDLPVIPIPGTRRRTRIEENTAATRIVLSEDDLGVLEPIASQVSGDRYADMTFASAGRE